MLYNVTRYNETTLSVDTRVIVLSSQHEDMLFRIRFDVTRPGAPPATLLSEPLRVISKADTGRRRLKTPRPQGAASPTPRSRASSVRDGASSSGSTSDSAEIDRDALVQALQHQQRVIQDLAAQPQTASAQAFLRATLQLYASMPQPVRIQQLLRFVATLSPQENTIFLQLLDVFRLAPHHSHPGDSQREN